MSEDSQRNQITVRVIRDGAPEPPDNDWSKATPEERIEAVWTLTELCFAWNQSSTRFNPWHWRVAEVTLC